MGKRELDSRRYIILIVVVAAMISIVAGAFIYARNNGIAHEKTAIYRMMMEYNEDDDIKALDNFSFSEDSPEQTFVDGLKLFAGNDYEGAKELFLKVEGEIENNGDRALPFYLYYYLNECETAITGEGNSGYVDKAVEASIAYPLAADEHRLVWAAIYSVSIDKETDEIARNQMEKIIENVPNLSDEATVRYNNCIAMLYFFDGNYAKSIRKFYDTRALIEDMEMTPYLLDQKLFTNSYIALFYYEFKDYETAIYLLEQNIAEPVEDPVVNANRKYSDYINLSSAYVDLNNSKKALEVCEKMQEIMPYIDDEIRYSVEASYYDVYAGAAIIDKDFKKAEEYIKLEEDLITSPENESFAFYGEAEFLEYTKAKLLCAKEEYKEAKVVLEALRDNENAEYVGALGDTYELLLTVYDKLGERDNYANTAIAIRDYEKEQNQAIKREYLEFSQYYATSEALQKENRALELRTRLYYVIIGLVILAFVLALLFIALVRKSGMTDSLTGIKNRRALHVYAKKNQHKGIAKNTSVIMIDIDYFKKYNDTYGHLEGDIVLRKVTQAIKESLRRKDFIVRYGGEEFLIILEGLSEENALSICERIVANVRNKKIPHKASDVSEYVTISLGISYNEEDGANLESLLSSADEALYTAKRDGRDRIKFISYNH